MIHAQVMLPAKSGIERDNCINTFNVAGMDDPGPTDANALMMALAAFYNAVQSTGVSLASFISPSINRTTGTGLIKLYQVVDLDGSEPLGSPIFLTTWTVGAIGTYVKAMPNEVALAVQLRTAFTPTEPVEAPDGDDPGTLVDRPRQRVTGHVYLGPWNDSAAQDNATTGTSGPSALVLPTIADACIDLKAACDTLGAQWSVWSKSNAGSAAITNIKIDNAWDTQRRRGNDATAAYTENL